MADKLRQILPLIVALSVVVWPALAAAQTPSQKIDKLSEAASTAYHAGDYAAAVRDGTLALAIAETALGADHPRVGGIVFDLALSLHASGDYAAASQRMLRALRMREARLGKEHRDVGIAAWWLGNELNRLERYAESQPHLERAARILAATMGEERAETSSALHDLGWSLRFQGKNEAAILVYEHALAIRKKVHGERHLEVAQTAHHLAWAYLNIGRSELAEATFRLALEIKEKELGADHVDIGWLTEGIGRAMVGRERYAEAVPLFAREVRIKEQQFGAEDIQTGYALHRYANALRHTGQCTAAMPLFQRALQIKERKIGPDDIEVGYTANEVGWCALALERFSDAEDAFRRALRLKEKHLAADDTQVAWTLDGLVQTLMNLSRFDDAMDLARRSLAIKRQKLGPDALETIRAMTATGTSLVKAARYPEGRQVLEEVSRILADKRPELKAELVTVLGMLGAVRMFQGDYANAEAPLKEALIFYRARQPRQASDIYPVANFLAQLYAHQGRHTEAEAAAKEALEAAEAADPPSPRAQAYALNTLAVVYNYQGRYVEGEQILKRVVAMAEALFGENSADVATALANLAEVYIQIGRYADADTLLERVLRIRTGLVAANHPDLAATHYNRARLAVTRGRYVEGESEARKAYQIFKDALGDEHPMSIIALDVLSSALMWLGRHDEAIQFSETCVAASRKVFGEAHPRLRIAVHNLGLVLDRAGRGEDAARRYLESVAIGEKAMGPTHSSIGQTLQMVADLKLRMGHPDEAVTFIRRASTLFQAEAIRVGVDRRDYLEGTWLYDISTTHVRALWASPHRVSPNLTRQFVGEAFEVAQWVQRSSADAALNQMAARSGAADPALAAKVRERQDAFRGWRHQEEAITKHLSEPIAQRDPQRIAGLRTEARQLEQSVNELDRAIESGFPAYAALTNPRPVSIEDARKLLAADEVLIQYLLLRDQAFAWVVGRDEERWVSLPQFQSSADAVQALRCGLDHTAWHDAMYWPERSEGQQREKATQIARRKLCLQLLNTEPAIETVTVGDKDAEISVLPFDLSRAHALYSALLGPFEDMIKGKHLIIVPSGPLTSLPFNVLVTEPPKGAALPKLAGYRAAAWLGARQPISVLPSVGSLKALREFAKASGARKRFVGIGNPLLDGPDATYEPRAQLAREKQSCPRTSGERIASAAARPLRSFTSLFRGAQADIENVRELAPLPETTDELCEVGRRLGVPEGDILLGARATETALKDLSEGGRLADYAILHFATHGALTGQVEGSAEPGLILTPPPKGTSDPKALARDDGLLTASEIATLKLDADWVILSACNTAAGESAGAEALSGLARAFFYAGARALLVSHWEVDSGAAVKLTTRAFAELNTNSATGRAESLRVSMRDLIDNGALWEAHPSTWAPFVVVGEGGARR